MVKHRKRLKSARPALVRVREVGDSAQDYEAFLKKAGIKPAAYEEVFSLMVRFRDFGPNEAKFEKDTAASSKYIAERFLKIFGERVWGNDRKHVRSSLPNGGLRHTSAKPDRHVGKLVDILASAFREMRGRMFRPMEEAGGEDEEPESSSDDNKNEDNVAEEEEEPDAEDSAEGESEDEEDEAEEGGVNVHSLRHQRFEKKNSRLSKRIEYSEGEVTEEELDSSSRLSSLEAHRASTREIDDDMPYDFNRPIQGVTPEQQQTIDDFVGQLDGIKRAAPAMYHRFCLQVLRHYRDGRPI